MPSGCRVITEARVEVVRGRDNVVVLRFDEQQALSSSASRSMLAITS
jgi:hypothetical protein